MHVHPNLLRAWADYEVLISATADAVSGPSQGALASAKAAFTKLLQAPVETVADAAFMLSILLRDPNGLDLRLLSPGIVDALLGVLAVLEREARRRG
jgi:hypothetical protein